MGASVSPDGRLLAARSAAEGFAVGRSLRFARVRAGAAARGDGAGVDLRDAVAQVRRDLELVITALPPSESQLFEPEGYILDEIEPRLLARYAAGQSREDAVIAETSCGCTDLIIDLRMRLLRALEGSTSTGEVHVLTPRHEDDLVLMTDFVTPSLVASLPRQVRGLISASDDETGERRDVGRTSHAAILARGRGLPIVYLSRHDSASIVETSWLVIDAGDDTARVWVAPDEEFLATSRRRHETNVRDRLGTPQTSLDHLGVQLRVNVASPYDDVPVSASGIGLVRTEMMFAGRLTAPSESEQLAALLLIAAKARGGPVVTRLFDAGGDKPLAWLGSATDPSRGIGRLLKHPQVLATQLRALARAREHADVRVLLPFVRSADEVNAVRDRASSTLALGAMVESPDAVETIDAVASVADFVSIGTNDMTATALGLDRTTQAPLADPRVLELVRRAIAGAHARGRKVTICGEMAGDERGARIAIGLGADALSVAPSRFGAVHAALGRATTDSCRAVAQTALEPGAPRDR
jgi:phosphoenolpyruvate-protein kinase (PTS system EI component)